MSNLKRGLALLLVVCIVAGTLMYYPKGSTAKANDTGSVSDTQEYTNWTFSSVAIEDGTHSYTQPDAQTITEKVALGNSKFNGYVKFSSAAGGALLMQSSKMANLCFGVNSSNDIWRTKHIRFALVTANGNTYLSCGVNTANQWIFRDQAVQVGEEIFLQATFDYIDKDSDGAADDLQIKVWINGTQMTQVQEGYGNMNMLASSDDVCVMNYVQENNPVMAYAMLHGGQNESGALIGNVSVRSVNINPIKRGYEAWTFSTVGHANGTYSYKESTAADAQMELQHSVFEGYVKFSTACSNALVWQNFTMANLCIGIDSSNNIWVSPYIKFALVTANGNTYLACGVDANNQWIFRDKVITPGQEILLRVAFDYIDSDSDGAKDDLQLQVWINGTQATTVQEGFGDMNILTSIDSVCVKNYVKENDPIKAYVMLHGGQNASGTLTGNVSIRSSNILFDKPVYTDWTFATAGINDGVTSYNEAAVKLNYEPIALDGTKFSGHVNFSHTGNVNISSDNNSGAYVFIGKRQSTSIWTSPCIKFGLVTFNDSTYLACGVRGNEQWIFTERSIAPGEEIFLQVTFDYVAKDAGWRNDLQMHVWIDGTEVSRVLEAWGNWNNEVSGDDICALNCVDDRREMMAYVMLYANQEINGSVTVRSTMTEDIIHQKELTYDLADGEEGYILLGKGTLYVNGEQSTVGTTLKDTGDYEITRVYNGKTYVRTIHIVDSRSNVVQVPAVTYDALGGDEVMPLLGWYLPYSRSYDKADGQTGETMFTADKYYQLTKESGINIIGYTETNATNNLEAVREQLRLAEKYNIGMYVQDNTLWKLDESDYWNRISEYSDYESFLGPFVIDEPGTSEYSIANEARGDAYKNTSRIVNKYANLTGYINLLPVYSRLNRTGTSEERPKSLYPLYENYIEEAAVNVGAKMISFDRYPSDGSSNEPDWRLDEEGNYILTNSFAFYKNLSIIRDKAKTHNLPFWTFVETGDWSDAEDKGLKAEKYRQIEGEEILWYVNTALAYGTKAIEYYSLAEVDTTTDVGADGAAEHGLFDCQGNKTKWYAYVQKANKQIAAVDHVLMKSDNLGVVTAGSDSYITNNIDEFPEYIDSTEAMQYNVKSFTAEDETYGALLGVFNYYPNEAEGTAYKAYYAVNNNPTKSQTITLKFRNATTYSIIQNAKTTYVGTAGKTCELTIPAGEGVLIVAGMDLTKPDNVAQVVYFEDIEPYRINDVTGVKEYRAPEFKQDYVFAGWYTDETCKTPLANDVTSGAAYAKFVDADVLGVKIQINEAHTAIRFASTVDTLAYSKVGYDIRCKTTEKATESNEVYEQLYGVCNEEIMEYHPTVCSKFSEYFYTYTISGIPTDEASQKVPFIVNSYWITLDGTKVLGDTISYSMEEAIQAEKEVKGI